jgi:hypothetical protein
MKKLLWIIWQLPQSILAMLCTLFLSITFRDNTSGRMVCYVSNKIGVSFGEYIFLYKGLDEKSLKHELGHSKQSRIFGPLYLLLVGLPSVANNLIARVSKKWAENYYKRYPEKWADSLGGVIR